MFSTAKKPEVSTSPVVNVGSLKQATVIARGVRVDGDFVSQGDVVIDGEVHGVVKAAGVLTLGSEAVLKAQVQAGEAIIAGTIEGNVVVSKRLQLKATSKITGDISCETISIEAGACISGKMNCGKMGTVTTDVSA